MKELDADGMQAFIKEVDVDESLLGPMSEEKLRSYMKFLKNGSTPEDGRKDFVWTKKELNSDGTQKVKFVTQYADGNLSNIKTSTLFPEGWSSDKIINSIKTVGDSSPIGVRASDGAMLYRDIIDGVQIEVRLAYCMHDKSDLNQLKVLLKSVPKKQIGYLKVAPLGGIRRNKNLCTTK